MNWQPIRFGNGKYGVFARSNEGDIIYSGLHRRHEFDTPEEADEWATRLNGLNPPLRRCGAAEFERMTEHVLMGAPMHAALRSILVEGETWKAAAAVHGVTESGILRAMRRVVAKNHP